ncbi:MAG: PD-(D/E)XK nuclease family protein [Gammaproteobacteria bacterium]
METATDRPVVFVPYHDDPLAWAAERIAARCADRLPVLEHVRVLLPDRTHALRLRELLLQQAAQRGHSALLGPTVGTLRSWAEGLPLTPRATLSGAERQLTLVDALQRHAGLFGEPDPWRLADTLMELFDELTAHQCELPGDRDALMAALKRGYGAAGPPPAHLSREAHILHTLWAAWHQQLDDEQAIDPNTAYLNALGESPELIAPGEMFFIVAPYSLIPAEARWIGRLIGRGQAELILHGIPESDGYVPGAPLERVTRAIGWRSAEDPTADEGPAFSHFLDAAFAHGAGPITERAARFSKREPASPAEGRLSVFIADDREAEAHGVELQVRRWLLEGRQAIGVVTEDRRLARRIRALLERAGVNLWDAGGWALSTTSAAAALERWLQSVEEDFAHQPLMDLLKSPFMLPAEQTDEYRKAVYRLEQDIILHENIGRGLDRYRKHVEFRARRLQWGQEATRRVKALLDRLSAAAKPLQAVHRGEAQPPLRLLDALRTSLEQLGLASALEADAAGSRLLEQLEILRSGARQGRVRMHWIQFRGWLARALETSLFRPPTGNHAVELLTLAQSHLGRFDALALAGTERAHLPGGGRPSPYFNESVRRELQLPGRHESLTTGLYHFRCALDSAPRVMVSYRREQDGEEIVPSPWLLALVAFHQLAYGGDLRDPELSSLVRDGRTRITTPDPQPPARPQDMPRPSVPRARIPTALSANAHQRLIDCPYQFFAADCLGLKPLEEIREALEKSDYGQRVHRCLQAFHSDVAGLPGPFEQALTAQNREPAIQCMDDIARAEFAQDLEDNFMHRGWLRRWQQLIPAYIDWQMQRQQDWQVSEVESSRSHDLSAGTGLKGRLDRLDRGHNDATAIVDYKTGHVPEAADVLAGEAVQLPTYALLVDSAQRVEYLKLDAGRVESAGMLERDDLRQLKQQVADRLQHMMRAIQAGASLPAWGDERTCERCTMSGICRRQAWFQEQEAEIRGR